VTVEGIRLRVRIEGSGEPLLLVMGIGGNIEMWAPLIGALKGRQTIAFDAPGTGESALPKRPLRIKDLARIAGRLLDQLDYGQVDVLGVSFGGAIAQQLAFQEPERVRKLILAATACGIGGVPGNPLTMAILLTPFRYYSRTYLELVAPYLYGRGGGDDGLSQQQRLARLHRPPNMLGYYFQMAAMAGWTSLPFLRRISQPTLVMAGLEYIKPGIKLARASDARCSWSPPSLAFLRRAHRSTPISATRSNASTDSPPANSTDERGDKRMVTGAAFVTRK